MHLTRRSFLMTSAVPWLLRAAPAENVLVVVQLAGGNDGLNTVVPYEDDNYGRARTTLRLRANQVLKIGNGLGFHPELKGFARLFHEGDLSIVQGVGYPNMHRDHNAGMRNWQTASARATEQTGWLGRAADQAADPDTGNVPAVFVGEIGQPLSIHAREFIVPSIRSVKDWIPVGTPALQTAAYQDAQRIAQQKPGNYPNFALARSLSTVAQLMRAGVGIQIYLVELGGQPPGSFDNHSNQAGNHAVVLQELSDSVAAFCGDLKRDKLLDRMLLMTYSEFGRQLTENGRHGTGHGAAAPVFLAGGKLKGGILGEHPNLSDLDNDAPKPHTDFRSLYSAALTWLGMPPEKILGQKFPSVEL